MTPEQMLNSIFQETSREEYQQQFFDIRCDDEFYYLYKHLGFDAELKVLNLFKKCQIKFTPPDNFNDPYDCMASIEFGDLAKDGHSILQKHFSDAIKAKLSVTCFNNNPLNILMWSHYAQSHRGFLVEFRIPHPTIEYVHEAFSIQAIKYKNDFPRISVSVNDPFKIFKDDTGLNFSRFIDNQFLTKSEDWCYENEFRVLAHDYNPNDFESLLKTIPAKYISSVILGAKLDDTNLNKAKLVDAVSYFNDKFQQKVQIYQASLKPDSFKIEVKDHPIIDCKTKTLKDFLSAENSLHQ